MKKSLTLLFGIALILFSCKEEEDPRYCFECSRIIQTFDNEDIQILRQEDTFTKCDITEAEMRAIEEKGTRTEDNSSGGRQEFFTTCVKSGSN
ncbi:hypothetical protein [Ekhidna sp.]|uniref:hypothetical protein n=1 Tax=Ekhidna sp. TaxID=2608089 RepID=UPI003B5B7C49